MKTTLIECCNDYIDNCNLRNTGNEDIYNLAVTYLMDAPISKKEIIKLKDFFKINLLTSIN